MSDTYHAYLFCTWLFYNGWASQMFRQNKKQNWQAQFCSCYVQQSPECKSGGNQVGQDWTATLSPGDWRVYRLNRKPYWQNRRLNQWGTICWWCMLHYILQGTFRYFNKPRKEMVLFAVNTYLHQMGAHCCNKRRVILHHRGKSHC